MYFYFYLLYLILYILKRLTRDGGCKLACGKKPSVQDIVYLLAAIVLSLSNK